MGRQRKHYTDKFIYESVKEALKAGANRAEVAVKYNVSRAA
jgi:transposase-like protein